MFRPSFTRAALRNAGSLRTAATPIHRPELFRQHLQRLQPQTPTGIRHGSFKANTKKLFKAHPFQMTMASIAIFAGFLGIIYVNYFYTTYIVGAYHKYPEPVAIKLRRAVYYHNYGADPKNALKYYKQALEVAAEVGMDPFSDEVLGIKTQVAFLLEEKCDARRKAAEVLEVVRGDCLRWLGHENGGAAEGMQAERTRMLLWAVRISVKLGELYSHESVLERDLAEERLGWAVEALLKEQERRKVEGVKEGEGPFLSDEEAAATFEAMGHTYEDQNRHYLATPLFLQALNVSTREGTNCHSVVLMNNIAISLAQQLPPEASAKRSAVSNLIANHAEPPSSPPPSRDMLISNARQWATKALDIAGHIKPPERNEECDMGCAVATHNLAEFAEMEGKVQEARTLYKEAKSLAKAMGFIEGVQNAEEGLRRLKDAL